MELRSVEFRNAGWSFVLMLAVECGLRYLVKGGEFAGWPWFRMIFWAAAGALSVYLGMRRISVSSRK